LQDHHQRERCEHYKGFKRQSGYFKKRGAGRRLSALPAPRHRNQIQVMSANSGSRMPQDHSM
jgi:hypothetical protein